MMYSIVQPASSSSVGNVLEPQLQERAYMSGSPPLTTGNSHVVNNTPIIRTSIDSEGRPHVLFSIGSEVRIALNPDAATTIALNLLAAAYAARSEQAAFKYAIDNHIDPATLIRYVRDTTK